MFRKVLIANRGEIAIRVMRACKEMGAIPVAVYSEADRCALHVSHAFESYPIGPPPSKESYLVIDKLIEAARKSGADAIHPGYGFLAENGDFAEACQRAGITFIGPSAASIRLMGDKLQARAAMASSGVPIIPGSDGPVSSPKKAAGIAEKIGYPVIIKAAAGGGGKGMRIVDGADEFESALSMTMGEAESAFGNNAVYIEKFITIPRHIEVQVIADTHGNVVSLGERECSMQRRYQKVIEEAPSPLVDEKMRQALSQAAVKAARAAEYAGAGTVEFIVDENNNFYFLEMNTRLQVEHPVTEMVYGFDIVKEQFRVARGEPLSITQEEVAIRGWAIEVRIYAEDPLQNFMPSPGRIKRLHLPSGPGIRNENGIYAGYDIPVYYDPLLGKVVVWAQTRIEAIKRMKRALKEYQIDGVRTNLEFLLWALDEKGFLEGKYDTNYIGRHFKPELLRRHEEGPELATIAASIAAYKIMKEPSYSVESEETDDTWKRIARMEGLRKPRL